MVPTILETIACSTGMRFTAVARVTDTSWTACAVRDKISFGLRPGDELNLVTTICNEIRQHGREVIFGCASEDERFKDHPTPKLYGFESYISIPIRRADGSFFGTLCAIDPAPAKLEDPNLLRTLRLFAELIGAHLDVQEISDYRQVALADVSRSARALDEENRQFAALLAERDQAEAAIKRELRDTRRLRDVGAHLIGTDGGSALFGEILDAALEIVDADAGTVQLLDPSGLTLSFLATRGFVPEIVAHFATVDASSGSPCGIALTTGKRTVVQFDPDAVDHDGSIRWHLDAGMASAQSTPLVSRSGRPLGMFSTHWRQPRHLNEREIRFLDLLARQAADLIERNQVYEALQTSEREQRDQARKKDEFIAILAHELRNPLAPIRSSVDMLAYAASDPVVDRVKPVMKRQVDHMVRLIDDLLDVSRISSGKLQLQKQAVKLRELIDSAVEANRPAIVKAGIELRVDVDQPDRLLEVDPTRISQVLSNILHNATKFTRSGGCITITTKGELAREGNAVEQVIRIADTGVGIPSEMLPSIFDLFTQARSDSATKHGGMGIGLALARSLIELHGGTIEALSMGTGCGSEFLVRIPAAEIPAVINEERVSMAVPTLTGSRVLVVDDNVDAAESAAMLLQHLGAETIVAADAQSIVEVVQRFEPTLILLDIGMPGIDGYEACRQIRRTFNGKIYIAAVTGWGQEEDRRLSEQAGFDAHLTKPVRFTELVALAERSKGMVDLGWSV